MMMMMMLMMMMTMVRLLIGLVPAQLPCADEEQSNCLDRAEPPHALGGWVHQGGPNIQSYQ
eukprot:4324514-Karenia_brevis.AAC.1